ncbi:hypothetical protein M0G43_12720 [Subsaxibacter sp. CAU 1640]|uniref:hypothetical protein n=1 Tax=Subsaxibacter sp. CAU 1640 TaxID=2933271 RepID=UPI002003D0E8|nr:hypothetical protein [Subsaxibacter sp. CAU 1640]MCK7591442.1 hypothetical protein [Subsaxibacter sp. CAU 1640]
MKTILALLFLITTSSLVAQIQRQFFVEDVDDIKYATVNYCVDNDANISEVTIIKEKTTYENTHFIEQLREYLLNLQYAPDSQLKNNCYDFTFEFINLKYKTKNLNQTECNACETFKTGTYSYEHVRYQEGQIKRTRKIQKELFRDERQIYEIKWLSNCQYVLIYKKMSEPRLQHLIGKEIDVQIIDVFDDGRYVYRSSADFEDKIYYGIIKKVK